MEAYFENLTLKQKLILLFGACGIIFFLLFISFLFSSRKQNYTQHVVQPTPLAVVIPTRISALITPSENKSILYKSNHFSITYPPNWQKDDLTVISGGTITKFHPSGTTSFPVLAIQVTPISTHYLSEVMDTFSKLTFQQSPIILNNTAGIQFQGKITNQMQEITYMVNKNGYTYLITYDYLSSQQVTQKPLFDQLLSGFIY